MRVGSEWIVDAEGCSPDRLRDVTLVSAVCDEIIRDLGLTVIGRPIWHEFPPPGGVTGLFLLSESHLACHTYPEHLIATFNLYCCGPRPDWPWQERLGSILTATQVTVRLVQRGAVGDIVEQIACAPGRADR